VYHVELLNILGKFNFQDLINTLDNSEYIALPLANHFGKHSQLIKQECITSLFPIKLGAYKIVLAIHW